MFSNHVACPHCHALMEVRHRHGVEIDFCPRCRGVWLQRGELDTIVERCGRFLEIRPEPVRNDRAAHPGKALPGDDFDDP